jgi:hypothetical protein
VKEYVEINYKVHVCIFDALGGGSSLSDFLSGSSYSSFLGGSIRGIESRYTAPPTGTYNRQKVVASANTQIFKRFGLNLCSKCTKFLSFRSTCGSVAKRKYYKL